MTKLMKLATALLMTQAVAFAPPAANSGSHMEVVTHDDPGTVTRRSWFAYTAASLVSSAAFLPIPALAAEKFETYQNEVLGFKISVPASWEKSVQQLPDRRSLTLFIDPMSGEDKTLMFIAKTPIQPDFTSLGSFGSVDQVAQTTILPKGELQGETTKSVMLSAESRKNAYIFDYKVEPPNLPETHYRAIFTLNNNVLVTLTMQTPETRYGEMKPTFDQMVDSFGKYEG